MQNSIAPQQPQEAKTLKQKATLAAALASYPALTIMIFMRRKLGYRYIDGAKIFIMTAFLYVVAAFTAAIDQKSAAATALFATIMFALGMLQRFQRMQEIKRGISWYSYSRGIPYLAKLLPIYEQHIKRFVDPAVCFIAGFLIAVVFKGLGFYIMFSALCLALIEQYDREQQLDRVLDMLDNDILNEVISKDMTYFADGPQQAKSITETEGIATGAAPDISALIAKRKQRRAAAINALQPQRQQQNIQQVPFTQQTTHPLPPQSNQNPPQQRP